MTTGNAVNLCRFGTLEVAEDPRTGQPALVFVPRAIWERVPASVQQSVWDVDISLRNGEPVSYQLPVEIFDRLRSDIDAAVNLLLAESTEQIAVRADVIVAELRS